MYNGIIDVDNLDAMEILKLLEACDELNFNELIDNLQNYLIKEKNEWILLNLIYVIEISSKHQLFNLLQNCCNQLICDNPKVFLRSNDVSMVKKTLLVSMLKRDDLQLNEIDIW